MSRRYDAYGPVVAVRPGTGEPAVTLERVRLGARDGTESGISERSLRDLLFENPQALPSNHRARFLAATLGERPSNAQLIGEKGVERYAARHRLKTLLSPHGLRSPTGPDSVYLNRATGKVVVLEAKGGSSARKWTYGTLKGTNANTIRSAGGLLVRPSATAAEKLAAARVIRAAQGGRLETRVIRTPHVLGAPRSPVLEGKPSVAIVSKRATSIEKGLVRQNPELRTVFRRAGRQAVVGRLLSTSSRAMLPVTIGISGATLGVGAYRVGTGATGYTEYFRDNANSIILVTLIAGGALIGGVSSFGVGATTGAVIGSLIALPTQLAYDWFTEMRRREFFEVQRHAIDCAVEAHYLQGT